LEKKIKRRKKQPIKIAKLKHSLNLNGI